jgi:hypothetical protein
MKSHTNKWERRALAAFLSISIPKTFRLLQRHLALSIASLTALAVLACSVEAADRASAIVDYQIQLDAISEGYEPPTCWFHPRAGAIPGSSPQIVLTMQKLNLQRSDVFYPIASRVSSDLGKTWTPIIEHSQTLGRHSLGGNREEGVCDFTP